MKDPSPQTRLFPLRPIDRPPRSGIRFQTWRRPTLDEFAAEVEHEFGASVDTTTLFASGLDRRETLSPDEVKALCAQLGVPPEDFGV